MNASDHQYHAVPFKFIGVAREFPTAPKDSFLVANATYIARMTGTPASEYALIRTNGDVEKVASAVRSALADSPALQIKDIWQRISHHWLKPDCGRHVVLDENRTHLCYHYGSIGCGTNAGTRLCRSKQKLCHPQGHRRDTQTDLWVSCGRKEP